jgi:hypothetical protein
MVCRPTVAHPNGAGRHTAACKSGSGFYGAPGVPYRAMIEAQSVGGTTSRNHANPLAFICFWPSVAETSWCRKSAAILSTPAVALSRSGRQPVTQSIPSAERTSYRRKPDRGAAGDMTELSGRRRFCRYARPANQLRSVSLRMRGPAARMKKCVLEKSKFASGFNAESAVQFCRQKYSASVFRKCAIVCRVPPYALSSRHVRRDAMDVMVSARKPCADE